MLTRNIQVWETIRLIDDQDPVQGCAPEPAFWAVGIARAAVEAVRRPQLELADLNTTLRVKQSINAVLRIRVVYPGS